MFVCSFSVVLCGDELKEQCYQHVCIAHPGKILYMLIMMEEGVE